MDQKIEKNKLRFWLLLPLLVMPVLALGFYVLGGGSGSQSGLKKASGINASLPEATFSKDTLKHKTEYYDQAERRSARLDSNGIQSIAEKLGFAGVPNAGRHRTGAGRQAEEIDHRLAAIQREISRPAPSSSPQRSSAGRREVATGLKNDVDRLEQLMAAMQQGKGEDREMQQLNQLMQGILDVQHPERVFQRQALDRSLYPDSLFKALPAYIDGNQKAVDGTAVRLKLIDTVWVAGMLLPKGQLLFGVCRLSNQRLLLDIKHVRLGNAIVPVDLTVFSLDGMAGIAAPEAVLTGALNAGTDNAVRGMGMSGFDSSMGMQVATAGIDAARQLVSRKVRKVKVKLKGGTVVLLRDNKLKR
ncbi:conjugative transposon protein TraM [Pedobacter ureilyticus]|uniref:Conjugative transposon protein TraM n=1 Tax=Pedobacter ureilyticus TaxID=1393051 RepID=A0ABW9J881_9SPHI|nr:conjugative transposon protein TraM [Pedobacter helvus]